eukprot:9484874-Alexandrium_andersonii.AAC.1
MASSMSTAALAEAAASAAVAAVSAATSACRAASACSMRARTKGGMLFACGELDVRGGASRGIGAGAGGRARDGVMG